MKNIIHISAARRRDGITGGVEKFAWYLEKAVGCKLLLDNEYDGQYDGNTIFIVDGDHGRNIPPEAPIISVAHGTWAGLHRRWLTNDINDHTERSQISRWHLPNVKVVSVSSGVTYELQTLCNKEPDIEILHGIDTDLFVPKQHNNKKPVILHVAQSEGKGLHLMNEIQELLPEFEVRYLNAEIGEEHIKFAEGDIFLHASLSDGNSYACLEAMSCNLPCVVTNVGLFHNFDESQIGRILPYTSTPKDYANAIRDLWECKDVNTREFIERYVTFNQFKFNWEKYING